ASWNFIFWGAGHGLWLAAERWCSQKFQLPQNRVVGWVQTLLVFHGVCLLWIFFRSPDFPTTIAYWKALFAPPYFGDSVPENLTIILLGFIGFQILFGKALTDRRFLDWPLWRQLVVCTALVFLIISFANANLDFIYFVF
ncbi:MAG: hypothetical protein AAF226_10535, partial [Verrucomicrobiota bacterium]